MNSLNKISILLQWKYDFKAREELENLKSELEKKYEILTNKEHYIEELEKEKKIVNEKIQAIIEILDDEEKIKKEYKDRNEKLPLDKKIFSIRVLLQTLIAEKKEYIEKLKELEELSTELNYYKKIKDLEKQLELLRLIDVENKEKLINDLLIFMQKIFLQGMNGKINQSNTKEEIIDLIYQFRYYCMIPFNNNCLINQVKVLEEDINSVGKYLLEKANALKIISIFSNNNDLNYEILKYIYITRVMFLEKLNIKITKESDKDYINLYDDNIFDEKIEIVLNRNIIEKDFAIKLNKKIKVFM